MRGSGRNGGVDRARIGIVDPNRIAMADPDRGTFAVRDTAASDQITAAAALAHRAERRTNVTVVAIIIVGSLLRLGFATALGLGVDESYVVSAGRTLAWGYFDHPPAVWWLAWAAAHLTGSEAAPLLRLPFIALFALSTWLMFRLGSVIGGARAGLWATVAMNLSPVFGITTATWVLPDGPLVTALLGAALCVVHALETVPGRGCGWWLAAGICAGVAMFAKYNAAPVLLGGAVMLLNSRSHREHLRHPAPWLGLGIALAIFAPVILWNAAHGWASFAFQGDRARIAGLHPLGPLEAIGGEVLFVLPWISVPMLILLATALIRPSPWPERLLAGMALPPIVGFAAIAAWSAQHILFHWAAPGYLMLFPSLGRAIAARETRPALRHATAATVTMMIVGTTAVAVHMRADLLGPVITRIARHDPTIEGIDWTSVRDDLATRGVLSNDTVIGVPHWREAGKLAYALGPDVTVVCMSHDGRQFGLVASPTRFIGRDVLLLVPGRVEQAIADLAPLFTALTPEDGTAIRLAGRTLRNVAVLRGHRLRDWPPP